MENSGFSNISEHEKTLVIAKKMFGENVEERETFEFETGVYFTVFDKNGKIEKQGFFNPYKRISDNRDVQKFFEINVATMKIDGELIWCAGTPKVEDTENKCLETAIADCAYGICIR
jgi:hypothetical protein